MMESETALPPGARPVSPPIAELADEVLRAEGDDSARAAAAVAALRREVERIADAIGKASNPERRAALEATLRAALSAAGLSPLASPDLPLPAVRAGLTRLHTHLAARAALCVKRREP